MAGSKKRKKKTESKGTVLKRAIRFELYAIILLTLSLMAMAQLGAVGRSLTYLSRLFVGNWDFLLPLAGIFMAGYLAFKRRWPQEWSSRWTGILLLLLSFLVWNHMDTFDGLERRGVDGPVIPVTWDLILEERQSPLPTDIGGGMVGALGYALFQYLFDRGGSTIAVVSTGIAGALLATGFSFVQAMERFRDWWRRTTQEWKVRLSQALGRMKQKETTRKSKGKRIKKAASEEEIPVIHDFSEKEQEISPPSDWEQKELFPVADPPSPPRETKPAGSTPNVSRGKEEEKSSAGVVVQFNKEQDLPEYRLPPYSLLEKPKSKGRNRERQGMTDNAKKLETTLESFGVKAKVTQIHRGPAVTRYEVQPDIGVKVSRIVNLSDDIALSLAAKDIRIEAPIPGKAAVGIEVPNPEISIVGLRDVLESSHYHESSSKLSIALGRDISGEPIVGDLTKMPHLLVAGATGAGKSVCINDIICSILYKAKPNEVKFMMIDPKMVELNIYNGIPHLLAPVVTDSRKAAIALKKVVAEMEKRYERFADSGARDIERYNQIQKEQGSEGLTLPYIVVIVDELADLMMVAPADVEDAICRLAQMARAAGIHLIIATQRPSVDVITGVIKANIPSRIAFGVSSQADSRTILDMGGAEKLLGRGDMLYLPVGASKPIRVQGSYLSDKEVEAVVRFVTDQQEVRYQEEMIPEDTGSGSDEEVEDELFPQAVQLVVEAKTASVSLLQRRLRIGYTRAARLIDFMEERGIVGPYEGSKPREVLMGPEQWSQQQQNRNASI
ncbi:FtsK/SpoIIIE family DNA translocase [Desmospora profundinema]|uniref:S-DNA-T family DNA segregation ATPase FtsK/SpoIIIE n=1 Tax=Desmospora profundinema TaxID=1571184 RepID=A0ABU1IIL8_9BACL|nr:DNA translocase FtsK [Desmospora profundinema]MDR6224238.1 S-DNA-T family DNA segregation ATPase FtsK/SpoIIIE [Desmospora profundinema]